MCYIQRKASSWLFFECPASVCGRCRNSTESFALPTPQKTRICFLPVLLKQQIEFWLKRWPWQLWVAYSVKSNLESDALLLLGENQAVTAAPDVNSLIAPLLSDCFSAQLVVEVYFSTAEYCIAVWSVLCDLQFCSKTVILPLLSCNIGACLFIMLKG